jgi:hypothetical protein
MSLTTTEYAVRRMRRGVCQSQHGPYLTMEQAEQQKEHGEWLHGAEAADRGEHRTTADYWIIVERDVTDWEPVPTTEPPWPEED